MRKEEEPRSPGTCAEGTCIYRRASKLFSECSPGLHWSLCLPKSRNLHKSQLESPSAQRDTATQQRSNAPQPLDQWTRRVSAARHSAHPLASQVRDSRSSANMHFSSMSPRTSSTSQEPIYYSLCGRYGRTSPRPSGWASHVPVVKSQGFVWVYCLE